MYGRVRSPCILWCAGLAMCLCSSLFWNRDKAYTCIFAEVHIACMAVGLGAGKLHGQRIVTQPFHPFRSALEFRLFFCFVFQSSCLLPHTHTHRNTWFGVRPIAYLVQCQIVFIALRLAGSWFSHISNFIVCEWTRVHSHRIRMVWRMNRARKAEKEISSKKTICIGRRCRMRIANGVHSAHDIYFLFANGTSNFTKSHCAALSSRFSCIAQAHTAKSSTFRFVSLLLMPSLGRCSPLLACCLINGRVIERGKK